MSSDDLTLEQRRARHALAAVHTVRDQQASLGASYRREANGLAANIVNNGLGQTCGSLLAKDDQGADRLYDNLSAWLSSDEYASPYDGDLITEITQNDQRSYVHAQAESLAWLVWNKKFARAYLKDDGGSDG